MFRKIKRFRISGFSVDLVDKESSVGSTEVFAPCKLLDHVPCRA